MAGYSYLAMRKDTIRKGGSCETRAATVAYWEWFHTSPAANDIARTHGFSPLPIIVRNTVLARLKKDILCNHVPVVKPTPYLDVNQSTIPVLSPFMTILSQSYSVRRADGRPSAR
eukprot:763409-Hanusia_phi.AAC.5